MPSKSYSLPAFSGTLYGLINAILHPPLYTGLFDKQLQIGNILPKTFVLPIDS